LTGGESNVMMATLSRISVRINGFPFRIIHGIKSFPS
jgi:hypothetical protein